MFKEFEIPKYPPTLMLEINPKKVLDLYTTTDPYCIRTPANLKPLCKNCGICPSKEFIKNNLTREFEVTSTEDIYNYRPTDTNYIVRILYQIPEDLRYQKKVVLDTFISGRVADNNIECLPYLLRVNPISELGWKNKENIYYGLHAFDLEFSEECNINLPNLSDLGIVFKEIKSYNVTTINSEVLSLFDYSLPLSYSQKMKELVLNFQENPIYTKYIDDRDGLKPVKVRHEFSRSIKLITKDRLHIVFPVNKEQPYELLKAIVKFKIPDIYLKGKLSRIGLFLIDNKLGVCNKHKLNNLCDLFGNPINKCINCILGF